MTDLQAIYENNVGKRAAFANIYESCAPYLYSIIKRYIKAPEDHKDLMQETFAKIFLYLKSYNPAKGEFKAWIRKITINECFKLLKQKKKLSHLNVAYQKEDVEELCFPNYDALTKSDVEMYLQRMPERYRIVFMLTVLDGHSHKEIAELLQINEATSRSQLSRAKKWIKKELLPELKLYIDGTA